MTYYSDWHAMPSTLVVLTERPSLGVIRLKYFAFAGFAFFAVFLVWAVATEANWAWTLSIMGGGFWIGFGSAYRKNIFSNRQAQFANPVAVKFEDVA